MERALRLENLGKKFRHRTNDTPNTFRGWVEGGWRTGRQENFWALRGITLDVAPGEMLGVIGRNGSGKSTLLRLLGGVMRADEGRVVAAGPVNGLLELNTGMHPDLTGRENIIINGVLAGLLKQEVQERMDSIIAFAELDEHIDDPVRTYSSGMKLRLGFAVAVNVDPNILLIDEVLAVGDLGFQQKCLARIREFKSRGCAIVLISHDMTQVKAMCDRALWIDRGQLQALGQPHEVISEFEASMSKETLRRTSAAARNRPEERTAPDRVGSGEVELSEVTLLGLKDQTLDVIAPGDGLIVQATVICRPGSEGWRMSVTISDQFGTSCLDVNTEADNLVMPSPNVPVTVRLRLDRLDLSPGEYSVSIGVWQADWRYAYDYRSNIKSLEVSGATRLKSVLSPPRSWMVVT